MTGYVYLMESCGYYKIGLSRSPQGRRLGWENMTRPPDVVKMPDVLWAVKVENPRRCERVLHSRFHSQRTQGEWFRLSPSDVQWITSLSSDGLTAWCEEVSPPPPASKSGSSKIVRFFINTEDEERINQVGARMGNASLTTVCRSALTIGIAEIERRFKIRNDADEPLLSSFSSSQQDDDDEQDEPSRAPTPHRARGASSSSSDDDVIEETEL